MSENELATRQALPAGANIGSVSIEQERAIAEAQGQMILAKRFPRDLNASYAELMDSCKLMSMAQSAFYTVPRGGSNVSGPSIRLAEEIARVCGNIEYGHRELSRDDYKSEIEVYAWDKQTNTRNIRQLTVLHVIDTKQGGKPCRDQREIDDLIANKASKQLRGRILAIVPKWMLEGAILECKKTLAGNNDEPLSSKARKLVIAFSKYGITAEHIEKRIGHALDQILLDEYVDLVGIGNALRDGAKASDYFGDKDNKPVSQEATQLQAAITGAQPAQEQEQQAGKPAQVQKPKQEPKPTQATTQKPKPDPKPEPKPEPVQAPEPVAQEQSTEDDESVF